jgi:hypothetical protein
MAEYSPEKAGVGGSTPSLATMFFSKLAIPAFFFNMGCNPRLGKTAPE